MSDFNYSGYPTRDSIPRGYIFYQFVSNFRTAGGYGGLVPRQENTSDSAPVGDPPRNSGTRVAKGAKKLTMPGNGQALGHAIANENGRNGGKFDAVEGEARSEAKWRNAPQR